MVRIETYVFIDLETTGLPRLELNKTRITEISMVAVKREHLLEESGAPPRVQHKLTLCLNPRRLVTNDSTKITGLCNFLLEHEPEFNNRVFSLLDTFLSILTQPVCLIAYNGFNFDYPVLQNEIKKLKLNFTEDVLCADALHAYYHIENEESSIVSCNVVTNIDRSPYKMQENTSLNELQASSVNQSNNQITDEQTESKDESDFYKPNISMQILNETTPKSLKRNSTENIHGGIKKARRQLFPWKKEDKPINSYKLIDVYQRIVKKSAEDAHRAESDCLFCLEISARVAKKFVEWVDNNHKKFVDVEPMTLGVPI